MDPVLRAALSSWAWRPEVFFPLVILGLVFTNGWLRLRQRSKKSAVPGAKRSGWQLGAVWQLVSYWAGLGVIAFSLMSPLDVLVQQLFFVHMTQHLLLIMIAPPLLLLPNPMPFLLWGLPTQLRLMAGRFIGLVLNKNSMTGGLIRRVLTPGVIYFVFIITIFGWHDPNMYNAALRSEFVHDLEHITFFMAGMLFWWQVIGAGPVIYRPMGQVGRIVFTLAAIPPNMALGILLAFSPVVIYTYYNDVPRLLNMSVLTDQQLSGIIMWIPGSMMYFIAGLALISLLLKGETAKPPQPDPAWMNETALAAPGTKHAEGKL